MKSYLGIYELYVYVFFQHNTNNDKYSIGLNKIWYIDTKRSQGKLFVILIGNVWHPAELSSFVDERGEQYIWFMM